MSLPNQINSGVTFPQEQDWGCHTARRPSARDVQMDFVFASVGLKPAEKTSWSFAIKLKETSWRKLVIFLFSGAKRCRTMEHAACAAWISHVTVSLSSVKCIKRLFVGTVIVIVKARLQSLFYSRGVWAYPSANCSMARLWTHEW